MSKSQRPPAAEVLAAVRLVAECRELGDDAVAWQRHLADGLRLLTGGQYALAGPLHLGPAGAVTPVGVEAAGVWPSAAFERACHDWLRDPTDDPHLHFARHPGLQAFARRPETTLATSRAELVSDRDWAASEYVNEFLRAAGVDDGLMARQPTAGGAYTLSTARFVCDRPFPARAVRLTEVLQRELAPHLGRGLWLTHQPNRAGLSPRLLATLDCLLDGDSEKQAAARLRVPAATVHDRVKRLYRHFGVDSRPELLAYFLRRHRPGG